MKSTDKDTADPQDYWEHKKEMKTIETEMQIEQWVRRNPHRVPGGNTVSYIED